MAVTVPSRLFPFAFGIALLVSCGDDRPDKSPKLVVIDSPEDAARFPEGSRVELVGHVSGFESARAVWSSDRDGVLVEADFDEADESRESVDDLSVGAHVITLAAMVDGAEVAQATVAITVTAVVPGDLVVTITPERPTTSDELVATAVGAAGAVTWAWTRDGSETSEVAATVAPNTARKGETWAVLATSGAQMGSASVVILDSPPGAPTVAITPEAPTNGDLLTCVALASDADEDPIIYRYAWTVDGVEAGTDITLSAQDLVQGNVVSCAATPTAGGVDGPTVTASTTIARTLPRVASAWVARVPGPFCPSFACLTQGTLPEGATLSAITTTWEVDGAPWEEGEPIPDGAEVRCFARATDGLTDSEGALRFGPLVASSALIVSDTPPTLHGVGLLPRDPVIGDVLVCNAAATDAECPDVELEYAWTVDGAPLVTGGSTLDTDGLAAGQVVECRVTAIAGGQASATANVTIRATALSERHVLLRAPEGADGPITCEPDPDALPFPRFFLPTWTFEVNGVEVQSGTNPTLTADVSDCDLVTCHVTLFRPAFPLYTSNRAELLLPAGADCADNDLCTADLCSPAGGCFAAPAALSCNDGSFCTVADACQAGACVGQAIDCDDGDPCTTDLCHPVTGCVSAPATGLACDDGVACTSGDTCRSGVCAGQSACGCDGPSGCDDGNPCTADTCENGQCRYAPLTSSCDDGDTCTTDDTCVDAECQGNQVACDVRYFDGDGDTYGLGVEICACEVAGTDTDFTATRAGDCNDNDAQVFPGSDANLEGVDADCSGWVTLADGTEVPRDEAPLVGESTQCVPASAPLGWSLAPLTASQATFFDCGDRYKVNARGALQAAGGAVWTGTGYMSRDGQVASLSLAFLAPWQVVATADHPLGVVALGASGLYQRIGNGHAQVIFESDAVCLGNCCEVRQTGGCTEETTAACVEAQRASCANTWTAECVALATGCAASVADGYELSDRRARLAWDGEAWQTQVRGTMDFRLREEPVVGLVGCQDPDVRSCVCEASAGCCDDMAWGASCALIAETTCGDVDGRRCGGLYFSIGTPWPDFQPIAFLAENAFWFREASAQISLFPSGNGGTEMEARDIAFGRAEICIWPYTAEEAQVEGRTCRDGSLWALDATAEYGGGIDFFLRARAEAGLIPFYDDRYAIAFTVSSEDRPSSDSRSVTDVFGTPEDPGDDVHIEKGIQTTGYYQLPWAIPDVFTGKGRLLDSVVSTWSWYFDPFSGFSATMAAKVPIEVDFLPRNLIPGIQRLSLDSITWRGEVKAGSAIIAAISGAIKGAKNKAESTGTAAAKQGAAQGLLDAFSMSLSMHAVAKLQPVAPTCRPWNKGYSNEVHALYCEADQPTSPVWYFDGDRNRCVNGVPPRVTPTDWLTGDPLCNANGCGECVTALDCGLPWTFGCEAGQCTCRNDPRDDIYADQAACEAACPAHPVIVGNQKHALTFKSDGSVVALGDVYLNGRWIEPFGIPNIAFENPAFTLGLNFTTLIPTIGYNGDVYYRPSTVGGAPACVWPTDDPRCDDLGNTQACDPAGDPCPSGETCVCGGDGTCEVGACLPNVCLGETFAGDNCLVHGGLSAYYSPLINFMTRLDVDNLSAGNLLRLFGDVTSGLFGIVGLDMSPDAIANLAPLDPDLRDAQAFANGDALALNEAGQELVARGWAWADFVQVKHLELYASTITGSLWNVSLGAGVKARVELAFDPVDPLEPPLEMGFTGRLLASGPEKGLRLVGYTDAPTPTALMREKVPGLGALRASGDPFAKEARLVDSTSGLAVDALPGALGFSSSGEGTVELHFEARPFGGDTGGLIVSGDNSFNSGLWWAKLVTDPEDATRARIEAGYWSTEEYCVEEDGIGMCSTNFMPHVLRTVDAVVSEATHHHLALVFEDRTLGVVLDGVERRVELVEGEALRDAPKGIRRLRVGGAIVAADDVRIWRRARSSAEIEAEATYLPPGYHQDASLVGRWETDWDETGARDGQGRVIWRNTRNLVNSSLDGYYTGGASPVAYDAQAMFELSVLTGDVGSGFYHRGGIILDDLDGNRLWAFRGAAGLREGADGTEASLELYLKPLRVPIAKGTFAVTGDGPNGLTGDFDDGVYFGADAMSPFIEGTARVDFQPASGSPLTILDWRLTYGCPDDEPGCADDEKVFGVGGPVAIGMGLPDGMVLELAGSGRLVEDNLVVDGGVVLRKIQGTGPRIDVANAQVTVGASLVGIAGELRLGALGGALEDVFGDTSVQAELMLDLDTKRICGDFTSDVGFECQVHFCVGLTSWGDIELELGCGGLCSSDAFCGPDASCQAGLCIGRLPDGAPCYADNICRSGQCGTILRDLDCQDQASGEPVSCLGVCYSNASSELGETCWDDGQCAEGTCEPVVPLGGFSVVNLCMCSPSDCSANEFCSDITGQCRPKKQSGNSVIQNACLSSSECLSNRCHLGFCSCDGCPNGDFCATLDNTLLPSNTCEDERAAGRTCVRDAACVSDNCVAGFCGECKGSSGCASDQFCTAIGKCLKKLTPGLVCTDNNQCASNKCRALGNTAIKQCVECETTAECGAGRFCDPVLRRCEDKRNGPAPCVASEQCKSNRCNAGFCGCVGDGQCAGAFWCRDGRDCFPDRPLLAGCDRNAQCLSHRCDTSEDDPVCVGCTSDNQCPGGFCGEVGDLQGCLLDLLPLTPCTRDTQCTSGECRTTTIEIIPGIPVTTRTCAF